MSECDEGKDEGLGDANTTPLQLIGDQMKVSESQFTEAFSNQGHLSNSIGKQQELPQTSIKCFSLYTSLAQLCFYPLLKNNNRERNTTNP